MICFDAIIAFDILRYEPKITKKIGGYYYMDGDVYIIVVWLN